MDVIYTYTLAYGGDRKRGLGGGGGVTFMSPVSSAHLRLSIHSRSSSFDLYKQWTLASGADRVDRAHRTDRTWSTFRRSYVVLIIGLDHRTIRCASMNCMIETFHTHNQIPTISVCHMDAPRLASTVLRNTIFHPVSDVVSRLNLQVATR